MKKTKLFSYWGGGGGAVGALCRTQVNENFRAVRPHSRADKFITREKNIYTSFSYMGPNVNFFWAIWGLFGGGLGGP